MYRFKIVHSSGRVQKDSVMVPKPTVFVPNHNRFDRIGFKPNKSTPAQVDSYAFRTKQTINKLGRITVIDD